MSIRAALLVAAVVICTSRVSAQSPASDAPDAGIAFLPRFDVHVEASHLSGDDPRFVWDAEYAAEIDVVDYVKGRTTLFATYHVVLGEQFQLFDPNQGNYILGGMSSLRVGRTELSGVFYHQSRHLSDRLRPFAIAWNMIGGRVSRPMTLGKVVFDPYVDVYGVTQNSFVDYTWEVDADLRSRYPLRRGIALISEVNVRRVGVDGSRNRGPQTGAKGEAGLRLEGRRAALELFVAAERRIDPYPLEIGTASWLTAGFRLTSR